MNDENLTKSHDALLDQCNRLQQQVEQQHAKIAELTESLRQANSRPPSPRPIRKKPAKNFDPSRHSTRFIALKLSYFGHRYNGFEHANRCFTPLPTIEEVLWKALRKTRLISPIIPEGADESVEVIEDPRERERRYYIQGKTPPAQASGKVRLEISWEGCQYSKCGRTDRGVSAFGQVIGIRVRSARPSQPGSTQPNSDITAEEENPAHTNEIDLAQSEFDPIKDELPYVYMLNQVLPPDVKILAWCPAPPEGFDARYSCQERRYKYFFTNPAFCPTPGPVGLVHANGAPAAVREGWLDIGRMREAAKKLEGLHDYRNLCQIDASKQMPSCERRITLADIEEIDTAPTAFSSNPNLNALGLKIPSLAISDAEAQPLQPKLYAITIHGSAFLWHQVRCTAAVLFLVGQGLESPDIVDKLLDIGHTPGRPHYTMADDAPLVLWDCVFPEDQNGEEGLRWIYAGDEETIHSLSSKGDGKFGLGGVVDELWTQWQQIKLKEAQVSGLLSMVMAQGDDTSISRGGFRDPAAVKNRSQKVFEGSSQARLIGTYQPLMARRCIDSLESLNAKYLKTVKGVRRTAKREETNSQD